MKFTNEELNKILSEFKYYNIHCDISLVKGKTVILKFLKLSKPKINLDDGKIIEEDL